MPFDRRRGRPSRASCPVGVPVPAVRGTSRPPSRLPDLLVAIVIGLTGSITAVTDELDLLLAGSAGPHRPHLGRRGAAGGRAARRADVGVQPGVHPGCVGDDGADPARRLRPRSHQCRRRAAVLGALRAATTTRPERSGPSTSSSRPLDDGQGAQEAGPGRPRHPKVLVSVLNQLGKGASGVVVATLAGETIGVRHPPAGCGEAPARQAPGRQAPRDADLPGQQDGRQEHEEGHRQEWSGPTTRTS